MKGVINYLSEKMQKYARTFQLLNTNRHNLIQSFIEPNKWQGNLFT